MTNMTIDLSKLKVNHIHEVYSGRLGCACGCRGNYYKDKKNILRVLNLFIKNQALVKVEDTHMSLEFPSRSYVVYFNQ